MRHSQHRFNFDAPTARIATIIPIAPQHRAPPRHTTPPRRPAGSPMTRHAPVVRARTGRAFTRSLQAYPVSAPPTARGAPGITDSAPSASGAPRSASSPRSRAANPAATTTSPAMTTRKTPRSVLISPTSLGGCMGTGTTAIRRRWRRVCFARRFMRSRVFYHMNCRRRPARVRQNLTGGARMPLAPSATRAHRLRTGLGLRDLFRPRAADSHELRPVFCCR
jgi:hypothetical protein